MDYTRANCLFSVKSKLEFSKDITGCFFNEESDKTRRQALLEAHEFIIHAEQAIDKLIMSER